MTDESHPVDGERRPTRDEAIRAAGAAHARVLTDQDGLSPDGPPSAHTDRVVPRRQSSKNSSAPSAGSSRAEQREPVGGEQ